jgi:hypothetical protein
VGRKIKRKSEQSNDSYSRAAARVRESDGRADALHEAISVLAAGGSAGCVRVANALALWLSGGDELQLEDALGAGRTWRSARNRRNRDRMIEGMGAELEGSMRQRAAVISRRLHGEPSAASIRRPLGLAQKRASSRPPGKVED